MTTDERHRAGFTRRQFLAGVAAAVSAASFSMVAAGLPGAAGATPSSGQRRTCIHGFGKTLQWLPVRDAVGLLAEAGYGGIEYAVRADGHIPPERVEDDLPGAVAAAQESGLKVEMIATSILDPRSRETERILHTAAKLGINCYRMGSIGYEKARPIWQTLQDLKPVLRDLAALNRQYGIHGAWQNHAAVQGVPRVGGLGWDLHELLRDLDPQWIGCQYDVRHATAENGLAWPLTMRLLRPWITSTVLKDFRWVQSPGRAIAEEMPIGEGIVNFDLYFQLARELKIGGPVSVHFFYPPFEPEKSSLSPRERRRQALAALRRDLTVIRNQMSKHRVV